MAKQMDTGWTRQQIDRLMDALGVAGILRDVGQATYEMHPLLTSYLRSRGDAAEPCQHAFVDVMAGLADTLAPLELHEQRVPFLLHGANLHFALALAERLLMDQDFAALIQCLAQYALHSRNFEEASRLFARLAVHHASRGDSEGESGAYHQLGVVAEDQRDFAAARDWYLKSLVIEEKRGSQEGVAVSYHQLGLLAQEQRDFGAAQEWYLKSLAIVERQGPEAGAAAYHQLGRVAEEQRDLGTAREWYLKSLAIKEKEGDLPGAASTYNQLGNVAGLQGDFAAARGWYLKSLAIKEKQGDLHGAAGTYGNLGILAGMQGSVEASGRWLTRCIAAFLRTDDQHAADRNVRSFLRFHRDASPADKQKLEAIWRDANLGPFPTEPNE